MQTLSQLEHWCLWLGSAFPQSPHPLSVRLRKGFLDNTAPPSMYLVFHLGQRLRGGLRSKCAHQKLPGETKQCHSTGAVFGFFSRCAHLPLFLGYTLVLNQTPLSLYFSNGRGQAGSKTSSYCLQMQACILYCCFFTLFPLFSSLVPSVLLFLYPEKSLQWLSPSNLTKSDYSLFSCWVNKITPLRSIINNPLPPSSLPSRHNLLTSFL